MPGTGYILVVWQKGAFMGIGIQFILMFVIGITIFSMGNKPLPPLLRWLPYGSDVILSPFEIWYSRITSPSQKVIKNTSIIYTITYFWETGILLPLLRVLYAGTIGSIVTIVTEHVTSKKDKRFKGTV